MPELPGIDLGIAPGDAVLSSKKERTNHPVEPFQESALREFWWRATTTPVGFPFLRGLSVLQVGL